MNTITVDCGASFVKVAKFSDGCIVRIEIYNSPKEREGINESSSSKLYELVDILRRILTDMIKDETEVNFALANEMHGFVLADSNGNPLTDYISWQKELGGILIDSISSVDLLKQNCYNSIINTGMPIRSGLPSSNLLYLKRTGYKFDNFVFFYTLGGFIERNLFGINPFEHVSNAAATGLFDLKKNDWSNELITYIGCENIVFPTVSDNCIQTKFNGCKVFVYPAIGDQQAALLGVGVSTENDLSFNLGTGCQVSVVTDNIEFGTDYQLRPFFNKKYLKTIPHIPCGRAINVYKNFVADVLTKFNVKFSDDQIWDVILDNLSVERNSLKTDLSFFENAITEKTTGFVSDINEQNFLLSDLFSSAICTVAKNCADKIRLLRKDICSDDNFYFSGGFSRKIKMVRDVILKELLGDASCSKNCFISNNETLLGLLKFTSLSNNM